MPLELNGTTGVQGNSGAFVAGTAVASTSGTSIDFTSIPSWVKRITVMFSGVSTNGSSNLQIQIGSTTFSTSGYVGVGSAVVNAAATGSASYTSGFVIRKDASASSVVQGSIQISNVTSNTWCASGVTSDTNDSRSMLTTGFLALGGVLDRVRVTTVNGTDTFDAGSINIFYE
jgi:hypothetical protein